MNQSERMRKVGEKLLDYAETFPTENLFPTVIPQAAPLITTDPYAFVIATCLDRGTKAEIIWTMPYYIKNDLGHLDPHRIYNMSLAELTDMFARLPQKPRYTNDAPRTLQGVTRIVVEEFKGDTSLLWKGRSATDVKRILMSIHGVGPGIASMGVLLIEKNFGVRFGDLDRRYMDIKADVHTIRVLYRLGVSDAKTEDSAISAARRLNPEFPGALDGALWEIGRKFCSAFNPNCPNCPMRDVCKQQFE